MGYISIAILAITCLFILSGTLFGFLRGRNRSLVRLGLIVLSAIAAFCVRDIIVDAIMNISIEELTIREHILSALNSESTLPQSVQTLAMTLIEIIAGIIIFLISFFILKFATWMILYPIFKIFVKKESIVHAWQGIVIGFVQGCLIAFIVCVPLTGMLTQANALSQLTYQGEKLIEIPTEIGLTEYVESTPCSIYSFTGKWFYTALSTKTDETGKKVSIEDTCDIAITVVETADTITTITNDLKDIDINLATPQERVDTMKKIGDSLININNSMDELSDDAKIIIKDVLDDAKEMFADDDGNIPEEVANIIDNINIDDLKLDSAGLALNGIATYIEKTSDEIENTEPVTQDDIDCIVNGLADNTFIIDMLSEDESTTIVNVSDLDKEMFEVAIENSSLGEEYKNKLNQILGLN